MKRLRVAVLMGGKSSEHEISLISGREVVKNLDPKKYDALPIIISKDGTIWQLVERNHFLSDSPASKSTIKSKISKTKNLASFEKADLIKNNKIDIVFIAMHGPFGEDGTVQGFLELVGVPYTGSGVLASALAMDKIYSRKLFIQAGLKVPKFIVAEPKIKVQDVWKIFKSSLFVKPFDQGSSVGASKVTEKEDLKKALKNAFKYSKKVLVDEYIDGCEITVAVLGNEEPFALPCVEIVPKTDFFDFEAKYKGKSEEICPARISPDLAKKAQKLAIKAYQVLGCRAFARVDMIIKGKEIYVLEVNTIPGLTPMSLLPKAACTVGISYPELLDKMIELSTP